MGSRPRPRADFGEEPFPSPPGLGIAFADMLCEGAVADWAAVSLHDSVHTVPLVAGMGFAIYALAMLVVRLCGNRLFTRFAACRLLPLLAVIATLGSPAASSSPVP